MPKVGLIILLAILSGCHADFKPPRDTLVATLSDPPSTLDPRYATDANGTRIATLIFNGFIRLDDNLQPIGDAAEKWSLSKRTYIFQMRPGLKFHNGRAVTAEDIEFTIEEYSRPGNPFARIAQNIERVEISPEMEVKLHVHQASERFLLGELPSLKILPKAELQAAGQDFNRILLGTGPYRFIKQTLNEIRLESVSGKTKNIVFKIVRDDFTRFQKMLKGELDIAQMEMPADKVKEFVRRPDEFNVKIYPGLSMNYLLINFKDPHLKRIELRQALAHAVDRKNIIQHKLNNLAEEASSVLAPRNPYHLQLENPPFDLEKARQLIQKLKLTKHSFTLKTSNMPQVVDIGRVLANQLSQTGLDIKTESYEWGTFYADVRKGNFQIAAMKWVGIVDPDIYRTAFHSKEAPPGRNRGSYKNPELDLWLDKGYQETNSLIRKKIYHQAQRMVHADVAIIPLWYEQQVAISRKNVRDYQPALTGNFRAFADVIKD